MTAPATHPSAGEIPCPDLRPLLSPRSIAVIGASRDVVKMGGRLVKYPLRHGFPGRLYPVNPTGGEIQGLPAYCGVLEIPDPVDVAIVVVSAEQVMPALEQCAQKGIPAAVVLASGFAETGEAGRRQQEALSELARRTGMRICGPNSNGLLNVIERAVMTSNPTLEADLLPGSIAVVSQSGGLGLGSILYLGQKRHIGFSYHISSGNEADVETADYIRYLLDDPHTRVISVLVEGFKDGRKFAAVADLALERGKPMVILKLGRTPVGSRMTTSHTALLAGSERTHQALFEQLGVCQVYDFDDLYEVAALFARVPLPSGGRIGVISPSGGGAVLSADLCGELGLELAELSAETRAGFAAVLPSYAAIQNPIDLTAVGTSDPTIYPRALELMLQDPSVDVVVPTLTVNANYDPLMEHIADVARQSPKPIICIGAGDGLSGRGFEILEARQVPLFRSFVKGFGAIRHLVRYAELRRARAADRARPTLDAAPEAAMRARETVAGRSGGQTEADSKILLGAYGIPTTREELARSPDEAVSAAARIGYPVALKGMSPHILHKTDAGLVRLGLETPEAVASAYAALEERVATQPGARFDGALVQEMVPAGVEVIVGVSRDPQFGPTVLFGLGGIFVEALEDVVLRVAPLSRRDAEAMVRSIRGYRLLEGVRGRPAADVEAVIDLLLRVSRLALDLEDRLVELDLNPVVVFERGAGLKVVDALAVLSGGA